MWIRVALNKNDVHRNKTPSLTYVEGKSIKEFYFDEEIATSLEKDEFLTEMWSKFDALFDWGDCDYFYPEKCVKFKQWLEERLKHPATDSLKNVYEIMLEMTNIAIEKDTGISFDF